MNLISLAIWLGTLALVFLAITSFNDIFEPPHIKPINTQIESPIQNTCQSGDLLPDFPKCPYGQP